MDVYRIRRDNLRTLADIRRGVRWAVGLGALALVVSLVDLTLI